MAPKMVLRNAVRRKQTAMQKRLTWNSLKRPRLLTSPPRASQTTARCLTCRSSSLKVHLVAHLAPTQWPALGPSVTTAPYRHPSRLQLSQVTNQPTRRLQFTIQWDAFYMRVRGGSWQKSAWYLFFSPLTLHIQTFQSIIGKWRSFSSMKTLMHIPQ